MELRGWCSWRVSLSRAFWHGTCCDPQVFSPFLTFRLPLIITVPSLVRSCTGSSYSCLEPHFFPSSYHSTSIILISSSFHLSCSLGLQSQKLFLTLANRDNPQIGLETKLAFSKVSARRFCLVPRPLPAPHPSKAVGPELGSCVAGMGAGSWPRALFFSVTSDPLLGTTCPGSIAKAEWKTKLIPQITSKYERETRKTFSPRRKGGRPGVLSQCHASRADRCLGTAVAQGCSR